jgi:ketosteroid isomerase-like protein
MAAVDIFHDALADGDREMVMALLAPDAVIVENGRTQPRAEYASGHLQADIEFARTTSSKWTLVGIRQQGDAARVTSNAKVTGSFPGKPVNDSIAELMVLRKTAKGWRTQAIHWSH